MRKFVEVLKDIEQMTEAKKQITTRMAEEKASFNAHFDGLTLKERIEKRKQPELVKLNDTYTEALAKLSEEELNCKIKIAILKNNAKIALMNDIIDTVVSVLNKYEGKPYGKKTKEKIANEIKEQTNCFVYLHDNDMRVSVANDLVYSNEYDITIGTENGNHILIDNKIQKLHKNDIKLWYINVTYVKNIDTEVKVIRELQSEIIRKEKELQELCNKYNTHTVNGINSIIFQSNSNRTFFEV